MHKSRPDRQSIWRGGRKQAECYIARKRIGGKLPVRKYSHSFKIAIHGEDHAGIEFAIGSQHPAILFVYTG